MEFVISIEEREKERLIAKEKFGKLMEMVRKCQDEYKDDDIWLTDEMREGLKKKLFYKRR